MSRRPTLGHRALDEAQRAQLYERIRERIAQRPERTVRKTYLATLSVAQVLRATKISEGR
jgi:hypothetical protein